jgi:hypothetical protein
MKPTYTKFLHSTLKTISKIKGCPYHTTSQLVIIQHTVSLGKQKHSHAGIVQIVGSCDLTEAEYLAK